MSFFLFRKPNQASPGEFPWTCLVLGKDELGGWDNVIATCVIVPEKFDNDVSYGTNKVGDLLGSFFGGRRGGLGQNL